MQQLKLPFYYDFEILPQIYKVPIDPRIHTLDLLKPGTAFTQVNGWIKTDRHTTRRRTPQRSVPARLTLVRFQERNRVALCHELLQTRGLIPGSLRELAFLCQAYPDILKSHAFKQIIATGTRAGANEQECCYVGFRHEYQGRITTHLDYESLHYSLCPAWTVFLVWADRSHLM